MATASNNNLVKSIKSIKSIEGVPLEVALNIYQNDTWFNNICDTIQRFIKITNDNLSQLLSTNELGCNLQVVNNTDAPIILPNISFSLLFINDV